jgi:hypothetical protein
VPKTILFSPFWKDFKNKINQKLLQFFATKLHTALFRIQDIASECSFDYFLEVK